METDGSVAPLVARVSEVVSARLEEVAAEAGVSYHTLYAWGRGRRNANSAHLQRLAGVVRRRARMLEELAEELEQKAASHSGARSRSVDRGMRERELADRARVARERRASAPGRVRSSVAVASD